MSQVEILEYMERYPEQWFTEIELRKRLNKTIRLHHQLSKLYHFNMIERDGIEPYRWRAKHARMENY